jgi:hypothetical protein
MSTYSGRGEDKLVTDDDEIFSSAWRHRSTRRSEFANVRISIMGATAASREVAQTGQPGRHQDSVVKYTGIPSFVSLVNHCVIYIINSGAPSSESSCIFPSNLSTAAP